MIGSFRLLREGVKNYVLPLDRRTSLSKSQVCLTDIEARLLTKMPRCLQYSNEQYRVIHIRGPYFDAFQVLKAGCRNS